MSWGPSHQPVKQPKPAPADPARPRGHLADPAHRHRRARINYEPADHHPVLRRSHPDPRVLLSVAAGPDAAADPDSRYPDPTPAPHPSAPPPIPRTARRRAAAGRCAPRGRRGGQRPTLDPRTGGAGPRATRFGFTLPLSRSSVCKQSSFGLKHLDSQAFALAGGDLDRVTLAALDLM